MGWIIDPNGTPVYEYAEGDMPPTFNEQGQPVTPWGAVGILAPSAQFLAPGPPSSSTAPTATAPAPAPPPRRPMSADDAIRALINLGVQRQLPASLGALLSSLAALQPLAMGSPAALLQRTGPQVGQLAATAQQQQRALSRLFGPAGGGQITRGTQGVQQQLQRSLTSLFGGVPLQAQNTIADLLGRVSVTLPGTRTATERRSQMIPEDFGKLGQQFGQVFPLYLDLFRQLWPSPASFGAFGPGAPPAPPLGMALGGSGMPPF